jgi:GNAT superfamily N-acetyltransferase
MTSTTRRLVVTDNSVPVVRVAADTERDAIRDLLAVAYAPYEAAIPPEVWGRYRCDLLDLDRHARQGRLLVATVEGAIAGYAAFYPDATAAGLGWPSGWASGRGLAVDPRLRGRGVAAALMAAFEAAAQEVGAPVFAFHTSSFMTTARALYQRLGYRRAPEFDRDLNAHYGVRAATDWTAIAYLKSLTVAAAA